MLRTADPPQGACGRFGSWHCVTTGARDRGWLETADMLVQEVLARNMRDRRAIARYAGLTGSPDDLGGAGTAPDGNGTKWLPGIKILFLASGAGFPNDPQGYREAAKVERARQGTGDRVAAIEE
jgi:hypothetical protein